jgi:hypothetical protein
MSHKWSINHDFRFRLHGFALSNLPLAGSWGVQIVWFLIVLLIFQANCWERFTKSGYPSKYRTWIWKAWTDMQWLMRLIISKGCVCCSNMKYLKYLCFLGLSFVQSSTPTRNTDIHWCWLLLKLIFKSIVNDKMKDEGSWFQTVSRFFSFHLTSKYIEIDYTNYTAKEKHDCIFVKMCFRLSN